MIPAAPGMGNLEARVAAWASDNSAAWDALDPVTRRRITKRMGFGDYKVYAKYRFTDFQPHTQIDLAKEINAELARRK